MDNLKIFIRGQCIRLGRDFCVRVFARPAKSLPEKGSGPAQRHPEKGLGQ